MIIIFTEFDDLKHITKILYAPSFMHMYAMGFPCQTISYISKGKNGTNCKKIIFHKP